MLFLARFLLTRGVLSLFILVVALSLSLAVASPVRAGQDTKPSWELEWEKTVEAAKREGQVTIYTYGGATNLPIDAGVFQKRFPEIRVVTVSAGGDATVRVLSERRAGKYLADVVIAGTTLAAKALEPIREAMILPEVLDESKWWQGKHRYGDPEGKYVFAYIGHPETGGVFYNTRIVNPSELQSFWDFLNPKWKGRIEGRDIRAGGTGQGFMRFYYYNPLIGAKFIRRLFSEMDITLFRDRRQSVDWLAAGKFPICFFCTRSDIGMAQSQGLPVGVFGLMKEGAGLTTSSGLLGFVNRAPHPNAAKVFINWLLSREGQITMQIEYSKARVGVSNSLRIDIPKDMVPPDQRLMPGVNYVEVDTPERISMEPILKVFNEALAVVGK